MGAQQVLLVGEDGVINLLLQYLVSPFILMVIVCDGTVCDSYTGKAPPIVISVTILHGILTVGSLPSVLHPLQPPSRFFEVAHGQLQLDIISWGSLIRSQSWQRAMQLVEGAKEASVRPVGDPRRTQGGREGDPKSWLGIIHVHRWTEMDMNLISEWCHMGPHMMSYDVPVIFPSWWVAIFCGSYTRSHQHCREHDPQSGQDPELALLAKLR